MVKRFLGLASDEVLVGMQLPLLVGKLLAAALIVVYLLLSYPDLGFAPIALLALIAVFLVYTGFRDQGRYYGASPRGLSEYRLGKKLRGLGWGEILQIGLAQEDLPRKKPMNKLVVTPDDCPPFIPGDDGTAEYLRQNTPQVFTLPNTEAVRTLLDRWYGPLDY